MNSKTTYREAAKRRLKHYQKADPKFDSKLKAVKTVGKGKQSA